jgi:PHD/YefM family antitoxin component YafN of YafNO toxin-antitoxin module
MLISLVSAEIPNTFYNINDNNNKLYITENLVPKTIIIPIGNYNIYQLVNELQTLLGPNYTVTYNQITNKLNILLIVVMSTVFLFSISSIRDVIGFKSSTLTIINNQSITSDYVCNLNYTNVLYLQTDITELTSVYSQTKEPINFLNKIPINSPQNFMIFFYPTQKSHEIYVQSGNIQKITLTILDDRLRNIDLNGAYFNVTLLIEFIEDITFKEYNKDLGKSPFIQFTKLDY